MKATILKILKTIFPKYFIKKESKQFRKRIEKLEERIEKLEERIRRINERYSKTHY